MTEELFLKEILMCRSDKELDKYDNFSRSLRNEKLQGAVYVMRKFMPLIETVLSQHSDNKSIIMHSIINHINNLK